MGTQRLIGLCISLLLGSSLMCLPREVVSCASFNSNSANPTDLSKFKKFLMQSYFEKYKSLVDSDFDNFMSQEFPFGLCDMFPDSHNSVLKLSALERNLNGEGSHRRLSTLIRFQSQQPESISKLSSYSCEFIIIERLPSGVFADPFELQHLLQRSVFNDVSVFGDTNLELPSFLSNRSAVEIHLNVDPSISVEPIDIIVELPLHARYQDPASPYNICLNQNAKIYDGQSIEHLSIGHSLIFIVSPVPQPLNETGYSTVEFGAPDMLVRCSIKEKGRNQSCPFKLINDDANLTGAAVVWRIPSGRKTHAELVSAVTFIVSLVSTLLIVLTSIRYSNTRLCKDVKKA